MLYYCSCVIDRNPATVYLTHKLLCTHLHSLLGGGEKNIYNLKEIDPSPSGIVIIKYNNNNTGKSSYFNFDSLKISLNNGLKTVNISPVVIDW